MDDLGPRWRRRLDGWRTRLSAKRRRSEAKDEVQASQHPKFPRIALTVRVGGPKNPGLIFPHYHGADGRRFFWRPRPETV